MYNNFEYGNLTGKGAKWYKMLIIKSTLRLLTIIFYIFCLHVCLYDFHVTSQKKIHTGAGVLTNRKFVINPKTCSSMEKFISLPSGT